MSKMFETTEINGMRLANRFVRSATFEGMAAEDGACTTELVELITQLAKGGVGLIITSHAYVRQDGQAGPGQLGIYHDKFIKGLCSMTQAVHEHGGSIVFQISHGGYFANDKITKKPLAPSSSEDSTKTPCKEMTIDDIHEIVDAFVQAAIRAKQAGFDGVQLHSAHGYLWSQFLSPLFNRRKDEYGGSIENRARPLLEVLGKVRAAVGEDFPVLIKMNCRDFMDGGLTLEESIKVGVMLQEGGIDAIETSGGILTSKDLGPARTGIKSQDKEAYFRDEAKAFKEALNIPIILVGGNRSFQLAERLVEEGYADYISMSRPLIREPGLIGRWASGDLNKAECLSDNLCFRAAMARKGLYCMAEERARK